jgi:hypothetical protein
VSSEENKQDRLLGAVRNMAELPDKNKVNIKGKLYAEVHLRVQAFREAFGSDGKIISTVHIADETKVMTETVISVFKNGSWQQIANDFAEEFRASGMVNKTSAVENCLTSSIGRALAACGLSGGNYASFEEVDHAINDKAEAPSPKPKKKQTPVAQNIVVTIDGKEWNLEDRMMAIENKISGIDVNVDLDTIEELLEFIYVTIVMFSLPPEGTPAKDGDPDTAAGWIEKFTQRNKPTLLELYKRGFQDEIKAFHKRLDPLRKMSISEIRSLQKLFYKQGDT